MNSGTLTLEASATGYTQSSVIGINQKTGDATRTLVGMARTDGSTHFVDTDGTLYLLSYYNRRAKKSVLYLATTAALSSSLGELSSSLANNFISWGDEIATLITQSHLFMTKDGNAGLGYVLVGIGFDSTSSFGVGGIVGMSVTGSTMYAASTSTDK